MRGGCWRCCRSDSASTAFTSTRTRLGWCGSNRPAVRRSRGPSRRGPRTFDFLGFTHYWEKSRRGIWVVKRKTASDRMTRFLQRINRWCQSHRHAPMAWQHAQLLQQAARALRVLRDHRELEGLSSLHHWVKRIWRKWLGRRSRDDKMRSSTDDPVRAHRRRAVSSNGRSWATTLFCAGYVVWICYVIGHRVPTFASLLAGLGREIPPVTRFMLMLARVADLRGRSRPHRGPDPQREAGEEDRRPIRDHRDRLHAWWPGSAASRLTPCTSRCLRSWMRSARHLFTVQVPFREAQADRSMKASQGIGGGF